MRSVFALLCLLLGIGCAPAQTPVKQSGNVTPGHAAKWITTGVIGDAGTAASGSLTSLGTTGQGPTICANSAPITGPYTQICLGSTTGSGSTIYANSFGGDTSAGIQFSINGSVQGFPVVTGLPTTTNGIACFATTTGTLSNCIGNPFIQATGNAVFSTQGVYDVRLINPAVVCNGASSTGVDAAIATGIAAGYRRFFLPANCRWINPQGTNTIQDNIEIIGEDWNTSGITVANQTTDNLLVGGKSILRNLFTTNLQCYTYAGHLPQNVAKTCPIGTYINGLSSATGMSNYPYQSLVQNCGPTTTPDGSGGTVAITDSACISVLQESTGDGFFGATFASLGTSIHLWTVLNDADLTKVDKGLWVENGQTTTLGNGHIGVFVIEYGRKNGATTRDAASVALIRQRDGPYQIYISDECNNVLCTDLAAGPFTQASINHFVRHQSSGALWAIFQDTTAFNGDFFSINSGNNTGTFTGNFLNFVNASSTKFTVDSTGVVNAATGYRIANAATSGNVLRGNGTNFVSATLAIGDLGTIATNTIVGNATSGTAVPTALAIGTCSAATSALTWTTNSGFGCNTVRAPLAADRTYYVRTDGSDSNTGLVNNAGGAFLTIQKAINVVAALDISTFNVIIKLGNTGTFSGVIQINAPFVGTGNVVLQGDTTTPGNTIVTSTDPASLGTLQILNNSVLYLDSFNIRAVNGSSVVAHNGGIAKLCYTAVISQCVGGKMQFGAAGFAQVYVDRGGMFYADYGQAAYTINGNATVHWYGSNGGIVWIRNSTITLTGTPAFSDSFINLNLGANALVDSLTFSGSATGTRFKINTNAVVGGTGVSATYFPGNVAGAGTNSGVAPWGLYQ